MLVNSGAAAVRNRWTFIFGAKYTYDMRHSIPAVFDDGVFRPLEPVDCPDGTRVEVQVPQQNGVRPAETIARQEAAMAWPDFVEQTYGSCAGLDLERHEEGDFELREPIA